MTSQSPGKNVLALVGWFIVTFAFSAIGARASIEASAFYGELAQPAWSPPPWLFGPIWTALYALMAVAAWLVWRCGGFRAHPVAFALFFAQLALNALWSWLFFAWQLGAVALAEVLLLWILIFATLVAFWRVKPLAGALLIPYLIWVGFAAALTFSLWQRNPQVLG